jgi:hypothetical protein
MTKPSVETKIREILTNPDTVGNLEITWGSVEDGDLDKAVQLISALFSTQQAQMREEIERQVIDKSMVADGCKVVLWADVLAIIEEKR